MCECVCVCVRVGDAWMWRLQCLNLRQPEEQTGVFVGSNLTLTPSPRGVCWHWIPHNNVNPLGRWHVWDPQHWRLLLPSLLSSAAGKNFHQNQVPQVYDSDAASVWRWSRLSEQSSVTLCEVIVGVCVIWFTSTSGEGKQAVKQQHLE